jgi:hypothetical protein
MIDLEQIRGLSFTMDEHGHRYMIDLIGELCDAIEQLNAQRAIETDDVKKAHAMGFEDGMLQEREDVIEYLRRETHPCCNACNTEIAGYIKALNHLEKP